MSWKRPRQAGLIQIVDMLRHAAWMARHLGRGDLFPFTPEEVSELAATIGVETVEAGGRLLGDGGPRAVTEVMLIRLDRPSLDQLLAARPALAQRFLYSLASRLDRMQQRLLQLAGGDLRRQVASLLLGETADAQPVVRLPQATLAQLLGATRPAVNRILKALEAEGLIRLGYREIEVTDPRALERIAAG